MDDILNEIQIRMALIGLLYLRGDKAFVVIEEPETRKFVQFGVGCLGMDVPLCALDEQETERAIQFFRRFGEDCLKEYDARDPKTGKVRHGATFHHDFGKDVDAAAMAALEFFTAVYGFVAELKIRITSSIIAGKD